MPDRAQPTYTPQKSAVQAFSDWLKPKDPNARVPLPINGMEKFRVSGDYSEATPQFTPQEMSRLPGQAPPNWGSMGDYNVRNKFQENRAQVASELANQQAMQQQLAKDRQYGRAAPADITPDMAAWAQQYQQNRRGY